jgi:L-iditol 2-dehydrogenase
VVVLCISPFFPSTDLGISTHFVPLYHTDAMGALTTSSCGHYLVQSKTFQAKDIELAPPGPDEVQIAPRSTTLCGSDLHYYTHYRNGSITVREPLCLGHESAGEILMVGSEVKDRRVGDKVAIECGVPCLECEFCLGERYNVCPKLRFRGSGAAFPHFQGTMQGKINHPGRWTHRCVTLKMNAI